MYFISKYLHWLSLGHWFFFLCFQWKNFSITKKLITCQNIRIILKFIMQKCKTSSQFFTHTLEYALLTALIFSYDHTAAHVKRSFFFPHKNGVILGWPKSSFRFFSETAYGKPQTNFMASPTLYITVCPLICHSAPHHGHSSIYLELFYHSLTGGYLDCQKCSVIVPG